MLFNINKHVYISPCEFIRCVSPSYVWRAHVFVRSLLELACEQAHLWVTHESGKPARMSQGVKQTSREPVKGVCNSCISSNILNCSD